MERNVNRRDWLTKTSLALAGGLVLGNEVMEQYERLTHKRIWALGGLNGWSVRWHKYQNINGGAVFWSIPQEEWMDANPVRYQRMHIGRSELYVALPVPTPPKFVVLPTSGDEWRIL